MRQVVAFEYMSGEQPSESASLQGWFRKLGALSARLHLHSRQWKKPAAFQRKVWDFDAMLGARPLWGDWRAGPGLHESGRQLLQTVADALAQRLGIYGRGHHRFGLVHADLRLQIFSSTENGSASSISTTAVSPGFSTISPRP
jgi:Ser/Thr protein kinase RdoA (MazF antagonist)